MGDAFYDLCYEEWRKGGSPDNLERDKYDDLLTRGFNKDEISTKDIGGRK